MCQIPWLCYSAQYIRIRALGQLSRRSCNLDHGEQCRIFISYFGLLMLGAANHAAINNVFSMQQSHYLSYHNALSWSPFMLSANIARVSMPLLEYLISDCVEYMHAKAH